MRMTASGDAAQADSGPPFTRAQIAAQLRKTSPELDLRGRLRPAAVLAPIVARAEPSLLLTRRTEHLSSHAGQICFPGGRVHPGDANLVETALREMEEEIGIARGAVDVAGFLDAYETLNSGYLILPVVGFLAPDYALAINRAEVADVFEAPLSYLLDSANRTLRQVERAGVMREFYAIDYAGHTIWGATAAMIVNLSERLRAA
jgi:8-oxo-dGTP pyrophosphatase MutT (NUDIX family)